MNRIQSKRLFLALAFLLLTTPVFAADEGGVTFPVVADFTDSTGTTYETEIFLYWNNPTASVYVRYQWLPISGQGEAIDYSSLVNPFVGYASGPWSTVGMFLRNATGKNPGNIGTLRVSPIDGNGQPLQGVKFSGFSRVHTITTDGGRLSERTQGIVDEQRPGVRAIKVQPFIIRGPHRKEVRHFWLSNFESTQRRFTIGSSAISADGSEPWTWNTTVEVPARSMVAVEVPSPPDSIVNSKNYQGGPWDSKFHNVNFSGSCIDCAQPYVLELTSINRLSGDVRGLLDIFSDR